MTANKVKPPITPQMKVAMLLQHYPELEETLIEMSSAFSKLRNPILLKTVAKVATLNQAAKVGDITVADLINGLRKAAGVDDVYESEASIDNDNSIPDWFKKEAIIESLDARPMIDNGEHPLTLVIQKINRMKSGGVFEIITPFYPAPMVDKVRNMGHEVWSAKENDTLFKTYFHKR